MKKGIKIVQISLPEFDSEIVKCSLELEPLWSLFKRKDNYYTSLFLISDTHVFPLFGSSLVQEIASRIKIPIHSFVFEAGESSKSLETAALCWSAMHAKRLDRKSLVIGIGGGVVTDLAGFTSACYMRGVDVLHLPTTLLGMVDAAIGGKTAVNIPGGKNLIGSFHQPKLVLIVPEYLNSLPLREFRAGLAEVIKYGVIKDADLFVYLENNIERILNKEEACIQQIVVESCKIKAKIIQDDPFEKGERAILNYGHTFAHAIEAATGYRVFLHGEAVSIGMGCAARLARYMKLTDNHLFERQNALCQKVGLPTEIPSELSIDHLIELMEGDKKSESGKINLILPKKIGKVLRSAAINKTLIKEGLTAE